MIYPCDNCSEVCNSKENCERLYKFLEDYRYANPDLLCINNNFYEINREPEYIPVENLELFSELNFDDDI